MYAVVVAGLESVRDTVQHGSHGLCPGARERVYKPRGRLIVCNGPSVHNTVQLLDRLITRRISRASTFQT